MKLDEFGRVIYRVETVTGIIYEYQYNSESSRTLTITNDINKSNFKTIANQILIDGTFISTEIKEFGETYNIIKRYEENKETYFEQMNIKTGKTYKKNTVWKDGKIHIWSTEYDGEKNIGFYIKKDLITGLTKNI